MSQRVFILSDKHGSPLRATIPKRLSAEGAALVRQARRHEKKSLSDKIMILSLLTRIGKAFPLQAWTGPEGSMRLKLTDFKKTLHEGGRVVKPRRRPPLHPENIPCTNLC
jgi:hypothetical protein